MAKPQFFTKLFLLILLISLALTVYFSGLGRAGAFDQSGSAESTKSLQSPPKSDRKVKVEISPGATFGQLMKQAGLDYQLADQIYQAAQSVYDLASIRVGRIIELKFDQDNDQLKELVYKVDSEQELRVSQQPVATAELDQASSSRAVEPGWSAALVAIPYEVKIKVARGEVETSMYQAALDNGIDIRAIIELANAFQWTIDFAMDPRLGDEFKFVYEERYLEGEYVMPGRIMAGKYINQGQSYYIYYFAESDDNIGYFDEQGNSVQKMFLKAPVAFKYITSGFTTGLRYIKAFNISTGHRAIDYAAAAGTPIRAVGDGTVISAGWSSQGYGYLTSIRHNGTYSTNYAHQSKIIVRYGQKVKQGEVIGYVGSTGLSTGPHLHYEMVKNGLKINPLLEVLPPGQPIKEENKARFFNEISDWQAMLDSE